jgi:hypothetical protein
VLREHMARLVRTELARSSGAEKQENFQPKEVCFFLTSTFIELTRSYKEKCRLWDSGFHGTKLLTMRSQSAVWPTATDMKDAITIPA